MQPLKQAWQQAGQLAHDAGDRTAAARDHLGRQLRSTGQQAGPWVERGIEMAGKVSHAVANLPLLRRFLSHGAARDLVEALRDLDHAGIRAEVDAMVDRHPRADRREIARRLAWAQAWQAARSAATGILRSGNPTARAQAVLLMQIAALYGMPLDDPARHGEILSIYAVTRGSTRLLTAGWRAAFLLRRSRWWQTMAAGSAAGILLQTAVLHALAQAACRYYESRPLTPTTPGSTGS